MCSTRHLCLFINRISIFRYWSQPERRDSIIKSGFRDPPLRREAAAFPCAPSTAGFQMWRCQRHCVEATARDPRASSWSTHSLTPRAATLPLHPHRKTPHPALGSSSPALATFTAAPRLLPAPSRGAHAESSLFCLQLLSHCRDKAVCALTQQAAHSNGEKGQLPHFSLVMYSKQRSVSRWETWTR